MSQPINLKKYLNLWAENCFFKGVETLIPSDQIFHLVVCIPACKEDELEKVLITLCQAADAQQKKLLIIVNINQPQNSSLEILQANKKSWSELTAKLKSLVLYESCKMAFGYFHAASVLLIDCFSQSDRQLPPKQGVGLARKICCDIACYLRDKGILQTEWIFTTDADVLVPKDYFDINHEDTETSAYVCKFAHFIDFADEIYLKQAISQYECYLNYYSNGLKWAGSPYYHSPIGSTLVLSLKHYALARGFPKKSAAEDFYLLNKLTKIGSIKQKQGQPLQISGRISNRVPFGTGQSVEKIANDLKNNQPYLTYHPNNFHSLKEFLDEITKILKNKDYLSLTDDSTKLVNNLKTLGFTSQHLKTIRNQPTYNQAIRAFHCWFDAFKTLKFIHFLRDYEYPNIPLSTALSLANFISKK